jgi:hypothetical protein
VQVVEGEMFGRRGRTRGGRFSRDIDAYIMRADEASVPQGCYGTGGNAPVEEAPARLSILIRDLVQ